MVGSAAFELRSVAYSPVPIGENPSTSTSTRYTDPRLIRRDGPLMTAAGANGIRIFDAMSIKPDGTGEVQTRLAFIREAALQGFWVVMGTGVSCDLDFANATFRANVVHFAWTDPSLAIGTTKAVHLTELRTAINAARAALGWQALTFSGTITAGETVLRSHLVDLRTAADAVRAGAGMASVSYTDPTVTVSVTPVRAAHILDLRAALQ